MKVVTLVGVEYGFSRRTLGENRSRVGFSKATRSRVSIVLPMEF